MRKVELKKVPRRLAFRFQQLRFSFRFSRDKSRLPEKQVVNMPFKPRFLPESLFAPIFTQRKHRRKVRSTFLDAAFVPKTRAYFLGISRPKNVNLTFRRGFRYVKTGAKSDSGKKRGFLGLLFARENRPD